MLDGSLPSGTNLVGDINPNTPGFLAHPTPAKRVHCLVMCVPAPSATASDTVKRVQEVVKYAIARGEFPLPCLIRTLLGVVYMAVMLLWAWPLVL